MTIKALLEVLKVRLSMSKDNPTEYFFLNELRLKLMQLEEIESCDKECPDEWDE